ncbi:MAG: phenol degradation protein meta [Alphaproteobacteria bacterium]|nr:MAG: phenol degradation protein meta [Alphaproteobacteria bacterium]
MSIMRKQTQSLLRGGALALALVTFEPAVLFADEGGVSFWLPGLFGSLAAVPQPTPGWSLLTFTYYTNVSAGADVAAAREVQIGRFNPTLTTNLSANLHAQVGLQWVQPNYAFATPVLGGQLTMGIGGLFGRSSADLAGTLTTTLGPLVSVRSENVSSAVTGFGDLYPVAMLKWHNGVHNYMVYATGDIPVGAYDPNRLANLSIGHGAADGGGGYTYLDPKAGHEFTAVTGLTYNFKNVDTGYQNGIDWHLDWGASKYLSKQLFVGAVGYFYQQLTADSGQAPVLGEFKSRVIGIGPQLGYLFPVGDMQGYLNLKSYYEFAAENRPSGWNAWVTFVISPAEKPTPSATAKPMVYK